ncbi:MAG: Phosphoglycerate mutase (modular protein) [Chloroflexi bacterium]|nr:Phosphoglycerate mutase (modular protein) [Chloroflexota bacterium]
MTILLLIRHAENDYVKTGRLAGRLAGIHLNETGRQQARAVADKLTGAPVKAVYSSPLERAIETATPIAEALNLEVTLRPNLVEMDFGEWQNKKLKGLSRLKAWKVVQGAPARMRFPQGESFAEAQYRICQELDLLARRHDPKDMIICVSHSDPIKLAVAYYLGLPLDLFQRLTVSPASITALAIGEMGSQLLALNYDLFFTLSKP